MQATYASASTAAEYQTGARPWQDFATCSQRQTRSKRLAQICLALLLTVLLALLLNACASKPSAESNTGSPHKANTDDGEQVSVQTDADRYKMLRHEVLRASAVRTVAPDTKEHIELSRINSLQTRKLLVYHGKDMEKIAEYFIAHPALGDGSVFLEANDDSRAFDTRRVIVNGDLDLSGMRSPIEELFKTSPSDLTLFISPSAIVFRTYWYDTYATPLTEDLIYLPFGTYTYGEAEEDNLVKIGDHWYYYEHIGVG
jgi:hypothetical protein